MNTRNSTRVPDINDNHSMSLRQRLLLLALGSAFGATYFQVIQGLVRAWVHSDEYSHGFFILPITVYIIWTRKDRLGRVPVQSSWAGLAVVIFSLLLYLGAHFAGVLTLVSLSMVLFLAGVVLFLYGWKMLRALAFPLFLLLFMIPVPSQFFSMATIPLQLFVSKISVAVAALVGVPAFREGNVIHLPSRTLEVVQACSGLRSLITLITLGVVIAYFSLQSNILRFLLVASAIPVAVFVNVVRVLFMVIAFYYFDIDLTTDSIHTIYGLVIFMLALAILTGIRRVLLFWDNSKTHA